MPYPQFSPTTLVTLSLLLVSHPLKTECAKAQYLHHFSPLFSASDDPTQFHGSLQYIRSDEQLII